jgi:putative SOS response-associated peptidase YedK
MRRFVQAIADLDVLPEGLPSSLAQALVEQPVSYNIGKEKTAAVIHRDAQGEAVVAPMRWGLIPRWSKQPSTPYATITARLDRAASSRIFSQAWKQRPCLIPMTGYYKWDRQRRPPWPRFIQGSDGLALLAAGIWERWEGTSELIDSFSILTAANHAIPAPLTPDGPVFLRPGAAMDWIMGRCGSAEDLRRRAHHPALESYPVARKIRNPDVDDYTLLEPVDPDIEEDDSTGASDQADEEEDMD